jgi:hypothetical protein
MAYFLNFSFFFGDGVRNSSYQIWCFFFFLSPCFDMLPTDMRERNRNGHTRNPLTVTMDEGAAGVVSLQTGNVCVHTRYGTGCIYATVKDIFGSGKAESQWPKRNLLLQKLFRCD